MGRGEQDPAHGLRQRRLGSGEVNDIIETLLATLVDDGQARVEEDRPGAAAAGFGPSVMEEQKQPKRKTNRLRHGLICIGVQQFSLFVRINTS